MIRALVAVLLWVASGSTPSRVGGSSAVETTKLWLRAVYDGKIDGLTAVTRLPFAYREAWPRKQCTRVAKHAIALGSWLDCVRKKEGLLLQELGRWDKDNPQHVRLQIGLQGAGDKLRRLAKAWSEHTGWVNGFINGDGATYSFLFAVDGDDARGYRVAALFIDVYFETG